MHTTNISLHDLQDLQHQPPHARIRHSKIHWRALCIIPLLGIMALVLFNGCVSHVHYRTDYPKRGATLSHTNLACTIHKTTNYLLGVVEIDDQGWLWDRRQMEGVIEWIEDEKQGNQHGLQVFVFVHGWQHNASPKDKNLEMFQKMLKALDGMERRKAKELRRKTVGVYVGWRGATQPIPIVRALTFWNRKRTAHEVGQGALSEVLLRIEKLVNETKRHESTNHLPSRLVVIGHSFGGAATYSALAPVFMERLIGADQTTNSHTTSRGFGDLVMLINPAFEAARYDVLREAARAERRNSSLTDTGFTSRVNLVILTSRNDEATGMAFPIGRALPGLLQAHRNPAQYQANITAVGHYEPFITHDLAPSPKFTNDPAPTVTDNAYARQMTLQDSNVTELVRESGSTVDKLQRDKEADTKAKRKPLRLTHSTLKARPNAWDEPFMVVAVNKKIIPDHSRIQKPILLSFLVDYLGYLASQDAPDD